MSTIHSRLSSGEKYDQFERARKGDVSIMIGPRSALFTPFENVGLIIIDEEHESSYKSDNMPRYHAGLYRFALTAAIRMQIPKMTENAPETIYPTC